MRHTFVPIVPVLVFSCFTWMPPTTAMAQDADINLRVMTRNLYIGADLATIAENASDPVELFYAVGDMFRQVQQSYPNQRVRSIVDDIEARLPHLIGLQEVALWRTQSPADGPLSPATHVAYDFLATLMDELQSRGLHYEVAVKLTTFDIEIPALYEDGPLDIRFTDRDVILVRQTPQLQVNVVNKKRFDNYFSLPAGIFGDLAYRRGWTSVQGRYRGKWFRFVNTHLEVLSQGIQEAQAAELLSGPLNTPRRAILAGDLNSDPGGFITDSYQSIRGAGFRDAWTDMYPDLNGFTCCQAGDLRNGTSQLSIRIDHLLFRGPLEVNRAARLGSRQEDRTVAGLWPSDHAGLYARLKLN